MIKCIRKRLRKRMNKVITIKDIVRGAGASIATVSRALNGKEGVSEETKNHVLEIVDNLEYRSNALARGLKLNRTNTIGVLFPEMSSQILKFYYQCLYL